LTRLPKSPKKLEKPNNSKEEKAISQEAEEGDNNAPPLSVPETTIIDVNEEVPMPLLSAADHKSKEEDKTPQNQAECAPPVKRKKRIWPKDESLAATRSKRTITPKIVRDYYRIGYG